MYKSNGARSTLIGLGGAVALITGCATTQPPSELIEARTAYAASERSEAAKYQPASLHDAKVALDKAESLYQDDPDSDRTRDAAYVAARRAELAQVEGQTAALQKRKQDAEAQAQHLQSKSAAQTREQLQSTQQQLAEAEQARQAAEARSQAMMTQLQQTDAAGVKQEPQGTVISVAGGFLFPSGKSSLLPTAHHSLDKIASALEEQGDRHILVEGHTDSTGSSDLNTKLSKERADAVATYLASHGVPRERMTTEGLGPSRPVADNKTPEGRANNRRVEITVQNAEAQ